MCMCVDIFFTFLFPRLVSQGPRYTFVQTAQGSRGRGQDVAWPTLSALGPFPFFSLGMLSCWNCPNAGFSAPHGDTSVNPSAGALRRKLWSPLSLLVFPETSGWSLGLLKTDSCHLAHRCSFRFLFFLPVFSLGHFLCWEDLIPAHLEFPLSHHSSTMLLLICAEMKRFSVDPKFIEGISPSETTDLQQANWANTQGCTDFVKT